MNEMGRLFLGSKGRCKDCKFQDREMVRVENEDGQLVSVEDTICGIFDVFVPEEGFCSFWESKLG